MKKAIFAIVALVASLAGAQVVTPNLGLITPPAGSSNWGASMNANMFKIDKAYGGIVLDASNVTRPLICPATSGSGSAYVCTTSLTGSYQPVTVGTTIELIPDVNSIAGGVTLTVNGSGPFEVSTVGTSTGPVTNPAANAFTALTPVFLTLQFAVSSSFNYWVPPIGGGTSSNSGVGAIIPGANTNCTPMSGGQCTGAAVTISATAGSSNIPSNANFVYTGTSINDDDSGSLGTAVTLTAWSTSGGTTTVTNSGTNHFATGQWISMRFATSWPACTSGEALGTGCTLFQVLSTGLSSTQFEITTGSIGAGTCSSTCGSTYSAMSYLPFATSASPSFPSGALAATSVFIPSPVTIAGIVAGYTTFLHPLSPAVTGHPGYLIISNNNNDAGSCIAAATTQAGYQTLFANAHADGYTVVVTTPTGTQWSQAPSGLNCSTAYNLQAQGDYWLRNNGKRSVLATAPTSTQYWDIISDVGRTLWDGSDTDFIVNSNSGLAPGGADIAARILAHDIYNGTGTALPRGPSWYGTGQGSGFSGENGIVFAPFADSQQSFQFWNAARTSDFLNIRTSDGATAVAESLNVGSISYCNYVLCVPNGTVFDSGGNLLMGGEIVVDADEGLPSSGIQSTSTCWNTDGSISLCSPSSGGGSTGVVLINGVNPGFENQTGVIPVTCIDGSSSHTAQACTTTVPTQLYISPAVLNCLSYSTPNGNGSSTGTTLDVNGTTAIPLAVPSSSGWIQTLPANSIPANVPLLVCAEGSGSTVSQWNVWGTGISGAGGSVAWGGITGTLSSQTDLQTALNAKAPLASPTFTGTPAAPTATGGTNTTQLATTAFVQAAIAAAGTGAGIVTYSGPSLAFTGTQYFPIGGGASSSTTETNVDIDSPTAVTIQNMTVQINAAPGVGNSIAFTWRKNASSQTLTCTISGASATSCSDTTHSFTTAALDLLDIQAVTTGTVTGTLTVVMAAQVGVSSTTSTAFSAISSGVNTGATMQVGSGAGLAPTGTGTVSANQLNGVAFCTGFTPTTGQNLQYTTGGSPNPCYTAASGGGSGGAWTNITGSSQVTASGCTQSASTGGNCAVSGSTTTAVTFSVIPGTYNALRIVWYGASVSGSGTSATVQFNSDSGSDYATNGGYQQGTSNYQEAGIASQTSCAVGFFASTGAQSTVMDIPGYADTSFAKTALTTQSGFLSAGSSSNVWEGKACYWSGTSAITSVTITMSADWGANTKFLLYGVN
jgi:hypothetical protein